MNAISLDHVLLDKYYWHITFQHGSKRTVQMLCTNVEDDIKSQILGAIRKAEKELTGSVRVSDCVTQSDEYISLQIAKLFVDFAAACLNKEVTNADIRRG